MSAEVEALGPVVAIAAYRFAMFSQDVTMWLRFTE
jgi:hypothetical protein